jgi:oxygen-independent coproporphyrinogen-3 oxidase
MNAATLADLVARYDRPGPRYTSYPTAVEFHDGVTSDLYATHLARADERHDEPLSLYVHLPFCEERCGFCGCNVVVTKHRDVANAYLDTLDREIELLAAHLPHRRLVSQMHWGGGTPTYLSPAQIERVFVRLSGLFHVTTAAEVGIEVDPRVTSAEQLTVLGKLGFNRLSLGVQDFTPEVQEAVNRVQSVAQTAAVVDHARTVGFDSVNIDLIYGLPFQTEDGFQRTLDAVVAIRPERVAVYSFAFVPWMAAHMKRLPEAGLPGPPLKIALLARAQATFGAAGYRQIGMDHFALPDDELGRALEAGTLHRNFMGYTVQSARDMVSLGVSAIGDVQGLFVQNTKKLTMYADAVAAGRFPIERGYALDADDELRRYVITTLMCNGRLAVRDVEARFGIAFDEYFSSELAALAEPGGPQADGLVEVGQEAIVVTPVGRMFVRNVCMIFDRYLSSHTKGPRPVFSRTV